MATEHEPLPVTPLPPTDPASPHEPSTRVLALRTAAGLAALFAAAAVGAWFLKEDLTRAGTWFFDVYGLAGLFVGTLATDILGVPVPVDVYLAAAVTADKPAIPVLIVACVASVLSGSVSYVLGRNLDRVPVLGRWVRRHESRGRGVFAKWGVAAVSVAAWTPLPFSIVCWFAGAFGMPYRRFFLATLHRVPRIFLYYAVIALGWLAGA